MLQNKNNSKLTKEIVALTVKKARKLSPPLSYMPAAFSLELLVDAAIRRKRKLRLHLLSHESNNNNRMKTDYVLLKTKKQIRTCNRSQKPFLVYRLIPVFLESVD